MFDFLPALITLNLISTVFYSSYSLESSPIHKDKWKALIGTTVVALLGIFIVAYHAIKKGKVK